MEGSSKGSQKTSGRSLSSHYSSCLLHEAKAEDKLHGIKLALCNPGQSDNELYGTSVKETPPAPVHVLPDKLVVPDVMSCGCCQLTFADRDDQKSHFKSDWHRYNIHRKLLGQPFVSEDKFEEIAGDVSSISGSDDDDEDRRDSLEEIGEETTSQEKDYTPVYDRKLHKVYFTNAKGELISVYRCLLHHKKDPPEDPTQLVKIATELPKQNKYAVLLISAGHFAGAVFHGKEVIEHKTFHRYTVRAKRGTAQSSRDQKGNAPKSAGARLRRYNEEATAKEVQELLETWKDHLKTCNIIFVRIPANNRVIFYGGKNPIMKKDDSRIRIIPFATRRPTFSEAKRVYQMLASIECYGQDVDVGTIAPLSPQRFYSKETEQLEVREPRLRVAKKDKDAGKRSRSGSTHQSKQELEEDSSDAEVDVQLVESIETLDLTHLREFEATKRKHKKKKKANQKDGEEDKNSSETDEDKLRWRNKLFTCCKTGDVESLLSTLSAIKASQDDVHNPENNNLCGFSEQKVEKVPEPPGPSSCQDKSPIVDLKNISDCAADQSQQSGDVAVADELCVPPVSDIMSDVSAIPHLETAGVTDIPPVSNTVSGASDSGVCVSDKINGVSDKEAAVSKLPPVPDKEAAVSNPPPVSDLVTSLLNRPVGDSKTTFLHLATRENHAEVITALLSHGADPTVKDGSGKLAYNLGQTEGRNAFRRFMADFPHRYDYAKAQVPSPLTPEMENEKKIKMAEKRKQKKKAANERNKDKKAAEAVIRAENQEKDRFMKLSDREKRALAADRRILQQHNQEGKSKPVLSRCFQCGADMTGKVPFEYSDNKFCTTRCLREHRAKPAS